MAVSIFREGYMLQDTVHKADEPDLPPSDLLLLVFGELTIKTSKVLTKTNKTSMLT